MNQCYSPKKVMLESSTRGTFSNLAYLLFQNSFALCDFLSASVTVGFQSPFYIYSRTNCVLFLHMCYVHCVVTSLIQKNKKSTHKKRVSEQASCPCFVFVINALHIQRKKNESIDGKMNGFEHFNFHFKLCADNCVVSRLYRFLVS